MPLARARTRRRGRSPEESPAPEGRADEGATAAQAQQIPAYAQGHGAIAGVPLLDVGAPVLPDPVRRSREQPIIEAKQTAANDQETGGSAAQVDPATPKIAPVSNVSGVGEEMHASGHSLTLQGQTDADYGSSFRTQRVRTSAGTGCTGCDAGDCVRVRGTLVSTYTVTTTVTLPSINDFPDLTPCQRRRVQDAITSVLDPHERRHVRAFRTYNGSTRQRFELTTCRADLDAAIQSLHDAEQGARQAAAQARSDALDPFQFDVDLDCEEPVAEVPADAAAGGGALASRTLSSETQTAAAGNQELET